MRNVGWVIIPYGKRGATDNVYWFYASNEWINSYEGTSSNASPTFVYVDKELLRLLCQKRIEKHATGKEGE